MKFWKNNNLEISVWILGGHVENNKHCIKYILKTSFAINQI